MQFKRISPLFIIALLALSTVNTFSQDKSDKDSVKLRAELVQIDVIVTDQNKRLVRGLTREDFELLDNGKPQTIINFVFEGSQAKGVESSTTDSRSTLRTLAPGELKRVIAFVVDTLHMKHQNVFATRRLLEDFVDHQLQPGDLLLILPTVGGSGLLQQFTADRRLLRQAIDRLHPTYYTNETTPRRTLDARNPSFAPNPAGLTACPARFRCRIAAPVLPGVTTTRSKRLTFAARSSRSTRCSKRWAKCRAASSACLSRKG